MRLAAAPAIGLFCLALLMWIVLPRGWLATRRWSMPSRYVVEAPSGTPNPHALDAAEELIGSQIDGALQLWAYSSWPMRRLVGQGYFGFVKARLDESEFDRVVRDCHFSFLCSPGSDLENTVRWKTPRDLVLPWWKPKAAAATDHGRFLGRNGYEFLKYEDGCLFCEANVHAWD